MEQQIIKLIAHHLKLNESDVKPESLLIDDLGADSLDAVELTMQCENEFEVEIFDEDIDNFKTVQDIINVVKDRS